MVLRLLDGFDVAATADLLTQGKWTAVGSGVAAAAGGRFAPGCAVVSTSAGALAKTLDNQPTWIVGFALFTPSLPVSSAGLINFNDGGTLQVTIQIEGGTGKIRALRGVTLLATSVPAITANVWHAVEIKVKIDPAVGTVDVRVDGVSFLALTAQNTRSSANSFANQIVLAGTVSSTLVDDVYILDGTGAVNNDLLGDCSVATLLPTGPGASTQFSAVGAAANWDAVNDTAADGDGTYVSSGTAGQVDGYALADLSAGIATVKGLQVVAVARKDDASVRQLATHLRSGGTNYAGTTTNPTASYAAIVQPYDTNPATGAAFTPAEVNGLEAGARVIA